MGYRKIWLSNEYDEIFDLTNICDDAFLTDIKGFGTTYSFTETRIGDSLKISNKKSEFSNVGGTLYFSNDELNSKEYSRYNDFIRFISQTPLYIHYQTPAMSDYDVYREIEVESISKEEIDYRTNMLVCAIEFKPLTFWINSKEVILEISPTKEVGKSYPLQRKYKYVSNGLDNIMIVNQSSMILPLEIEINGTVNNPTFSIYDRVNRIYGLCKFNGTFNYVYVNSDDLNEEIKLEIGGVNVINPINYQDASIGVSEKIYITFLYLKPGVSFLKFNLGKEFDGNVKIKYREGIYATF